MENQVNRDDAIEYNAIRNANFFLLVSILDELASSKGDGRDEFLQQMRTKTLGRLDAARQQKPLAERDPTTAEIAEVARSVVGAAFDAANIR